MLACPARVTYLGMAGRAQPVHVLWEVGRREVGDNALLMIGAPTRPVTKHNVVILKEH